VTDIAADENLIAIVHQNGVLEVYNRKRADMQTVEDLFNNMDGIFSRQVDSPLKCVKITSDSNYIVAYCEHREYEGGNHVCENEHFD